MDKTDTWFELWDDNGEHIIDAFHWPFCTVDGCYNRIKLGVSDLYCHPHSGGKTADKFIIKMNDMLKEKSNA
jgi:hypothetical protein